MQFLDFKSILTEIGQTPPLNLMAIFLMRFNLVLDRSLDWIIRLGRTSPDRCRGSPQKTEAENPICFCKSRRNLYLPLLIDKNSLFRE
jgi:hypothetical protein